MAGDLAGVEIEIGGAIVKKAIQQNGARTAGQEQRVRLPYRWTPNPVARELEFLSVTAKEYQESRDGALDAAREIRSAIAGLADTSILEHPQQLANLVALRRQSTLLKTMLLSCVLEPVPSTAAAQAIAEYYDSKETLGRTAALVLAFPDAYATHFEDFALNSGIPGIRLDPLSDGAVLRLELDTLLHATRTANNAKAMEIYLMIVLSIIAAGEMGPAQMILSQSWGGAAPLAEGLGVATAQEVPLAQAVFGAFMGFMNYVEKVGEVMADGEYTEDEELGLNLAFIGIFVPFLFAGLQLGSLPGVVQRFAGITTTVAGLLMFALSAINTVFWVIQSLGELIEAFDHAKALEDLGVQGLVAGDPEFEILIPAAP